MDKSDMRKDPDVQTLSEEIFMDWRNFLSILPRFPPINELLAVVISHNCGNECSLWMFTSLQLYLWSKFPQNKPKICKFTRNLLGRQVQVQLINILCSLSGRESRYFEEISNPQKSVRGRILTFLMSAWGFGIWSIEH